MLAEISAGLGSLNAAKSIIQGLQAIKTEASVNEVKIQLQSLILDAQQGLFAAQQAEAATTERIRKLENEIVNLKDWSAEKQHYELKSLGMGAFAYMLKAAVRGTEPAHWLCATCYRNGQPSIIQHQGPPKGEPGNAVHSCPSCKATFTLRHWTRPAWDAEPDE